MIYLSKSVSVAIKKPVNEVYEFVANPENLPKWASGLSQSSIVKKGDEWIADSPMGKVKVKFAERNKFGVLDHDVTLPSGQGGHNPLRVYKNADGSELTFTVYHLPKVSDEDYNKDVGTVEKDLLKLKSILEKN